MRGFAIVSRRSARVVGRRVDFFSTPGLTTSPDRRGSVRAVPSVEPSDGPESHRLRRRDVLLPGSLGLVGTFEIVAAGYDPVAVGLGTHWLAAGLLCARRMAPLAMPLAVAAVYALTPLLGFDVSDPASWLLLIAFACLSSGLHAPRSQRLAGLAGALGALAVVYAGLAWLTPFDPNLVFGLIVSLGSWALGVALREALDRNRRLGAEAEHARIERALASERAAASERDRISAELHDALAHALGAMVVQASVGSDLVRRDPGAAAAALRGVAQAGRDALGETGALLRLIRDDHNELALRAGTPSAAPVPPAMAPELVAGASAVRRGDLLLPALFAVVGALEIALEGYEPLWASLAAYWLAVAALCARRALPLLMPVAVPGLLLGGGLLGVPTGEPASWILVTALACFAAGLHVQRSRAAAGLASVIAGMAVAAIDAARRGDLASDYVLLIAFAAPWAVGVALTQALEQTRELAAEAERARLEQKLEAERSAAAERKRIARELHDVLANSLSVMVVQASLAADLVAGNPEAAAAAVAEVERSGRNGLGETRRLLRLDRQGTDGLEKRPQHGVADLPTLAEEYARAGLAVDLDVDGVTRLPIGVELSTYRIVQEALTNALKHAPGSTVCVRLARRGSEVAIEVRNGPAAAGALLAVPGGHGLVGLRERVSLFGGTLDAGPASDGGFVLNATLPMGGTAA